MVEPTTDLVGATGTAAERSAADLLSPIRRRYLDLLKGALTHTLYWPPDIAPPSTLLVREFSDAVQEAVAAGQVDLGRMRTEGRDWPRYAQTMVGLERLENVQHCVEQVLAHDVPGDLIETGAWRGGVTILMRGLLAAHEVRDRSVFVADSFAGLPRPDPERYPADTGSEYHEEDMLAVPRSEVEDNFRRYGLLDEQVVFLEGWFNETLPALGDHTWSVIRLDGDMYSSTIEALKHLYPGLSIGGFLIVDDFGHDACRRAVEDYRAAHGIDDPIERIDWTGAYWRRRS